MKFTMRAVSLLLALIMTCGVLSPCIAKEESVSATDAIKRDGPDERPWSAKWIWSKSNTAKHNWLCLRKTVELDSAPSSAMARISADSRYWLWINGELVVYEGSVKRGPNATDCYFDEVELAPYLKKGSNTIAVLAWYFGNDSDYYSYNSSGKAGFIFEADIGSTKVISDKSWKVHKEDGYLISTESNDPGTQPNYRLAEGNILYDATLSEVLEGWYLPSYDDRSWTSATEHGNAGASPWGALWQRSIPLLKYSDILDYENPEKYASFKDKATTRSVNLGMKLPYNMQIQPYLEIEAPEGLRIEIKSDSDSSVRTTYLTKGGRQTFEGYGWMNGHTIAYKIPEGVKIIRLGYRATGYNTEFEGSFECDDEFYNRLWDESLWTLYVTMRDNYMDCPDRERAQWWGDVTNESHMTFYALGTDSYLLYRKGVDTLINWRGQTGDGNDKVLPTVVPINSGHFELPMQQLAGVVGFWTYYRYTGEYDFVEQVYQPALDYLSLWEMGDDGLVKHRSGSWDWPDHGENYDVAVMENAWYYWALDCVLQMAEVLGETKDNAYIIGRMQSIERGYELFWDEEFSAYYKSTANGLPDDRGNALAVLSGLAYESRYDDIIEVLKEQYNATPYMEKYVLEAMFDMGYDDEALHRMKARYTDMVEDSYTTLWEVFPIGGTNNHAWSGGPLVSLSGEVAGVAPDTPGYDTYHVTPKLGSLKTVKCIVPSVKGDINVDIKRTAYSFSLALTSPADTVARVGIPRFDGKNTTVTLGNTVIFEDGKATGKVKGVEYLSDDGDYIYFSVQPGSYSFEATPKSAQTKDSYTLKIASAIGGTVKINGKEVNTPYTATYTKGTKLTLDAVAADGYDFVSWSGTYGAFDSRFVINIKDDVTLTANFAEAEREYRLVTLSDPDNTGIKVKIDGEVFTLPMQYAVAEGESLTVEAIDSGKYTFVNWQGDIFSAGRTTILDITEDVTLSVQGAYRKSVAAGGTLTVKGSNGSVRINGTLYKLPCSVTFSEESLVAIEPVADRGYAFVGWSGDVKGDDMPVYVTVGGETNITANFKSVSDIMYALSENYALDRKASCLNSYESGAAWSVTNLTDGVTLSTAEDCGFSTNVLSSVNIPASEQPSIDIDLGSGIDINMVKLYPRTNATAGNGESCNFPLSYEMQVRGDADSEWRTVYTVTDAANPRGKAVTVTFDTRTVRYIRLKVAKVSGGAADEPTNHRVQLAEIEVYHDPMADGDLPEIDDKDCQISVTPAGESVTIAEGTLFTAGVVDCVLDNKDIIWSIENADGTASDIAMLYGTIGREITAVPLKAGEAYLVARMVNGLSAVSRTPIVVDFDADAVTVTKVRIDAIGIVTLEKEEAIIAAREAYEALSDSEKSQVDNIGLLELAESSLDGLKSALESYHVVTFMDGDAVYDTLTVKHGEGAKITAPTRDTAQFTKYTFAGWVDEYGYPCALDSVICDMTVYAEYTTACEHPFTDVKAGSYYTDAVEWALMNGVMNGTAATKFNPEGVTDRAMIVTVLYRLQGSPDVSHVKTPFTDVKAGEWYANAIKWAYANGVVNGVTATTFNPKGQLTREQFATILYRYAKEVEGQDVSVKEQGLLDKYKDKGSVSSYAKEALTWTSSRGLIGGVSATTLSPKSGATRAQMATILSRYNAMN